MERQRELTERLAAAARAYYDENREVMPNIDYDRLYDELAALEAASGVVLAGSPTQRVGYAVSSALEKQAHPAPMLSLNKTKSAEELIDWLGDKQGLLSWKLDGLTVALTYRDGALASAVTRGNGLVGEVVTNNARAFANLPECIPFKGELSLRGEAVITYADFEKINGEGAEADALYKNPRNLVSGSVRQLDSAVTARRRVRLYAFALVDVSGSGKKQTGGAFGDANWNELQQTTGKMARKLSKERIYQKKSRKNAKYSGIRSKNRSLLKFYAQKSPVSCQIRDAQGEGSLVSRAEQMAFLTAQGFETVETRVVNQENLPAALSEFSARARGGGLAFPVDGLVLEYDDLAYAEGLGATSKYPRDAIAFKWADEEAETVLREIEWSASRTGLINPIAVFAPVELEGTTVSRASVHNVSILEELALGMGDRIRVYKANMIIPQISENLTRSGTVKPPEFCPVCGVRTEIREAEDVRTLTCPNPDCPAKRLKAFAHFVSRSALNIEGLSEQTLEKLIAAGLLHEPAGIFRLKDHREAIVAMDGFGERSFEKLTDAIETARTTVTCARLLTALGIPEVGTATAKEIARAFGFDWSRIANADEATLSGIPGVGPIIAEKFCAWFAEEKNQTRVRDLLAELRFADERGAVPVGEGAASSAVAGKTFVITGSLTGYENRDTLKERIEALGGKTSSSVSAKTDYLINNDAASGSAKNKAAKELGVRIITEAEFEALAEGAE